MTLKRATDGLIVAAFAGLVLTAPTIGVAQTAAAATAKWPATVTAHLRKLDNDCRELGETPSRQLGHVKRVDVTGDGVADYVFDEGEYMCGSTPYMFAGNGGAGIQVFVGDPNGGAVLAYDSFGPGVRVGANRAGRTAVIVTAQGAPCGSLAQARADQATCERTLIWNAATRKMVPGPPP